MRASLVLFLGVVVLPLQPVRAEFLDPMRPPAFALEKFRQEKIRTAPIQSAVARPQQKTTWVLSSILYSSQRQHAIINNQLVRKGDVILGAKLLRLRPDGVRLMVKGKIVDLTLYDKKTKGSFKSIKKSLNEKNI